MKFSEAIKKFCLTPKTCDAAAKDLNDARMACNRAGCYDEEVAILMKLVARLRELSGRPIIIGV